MQSGKSRMWKSLQGQTTQLLQQIKYKEGKEGGRRNTRRPLWNIKNIMNLITLMVLVVKNPPANAGDVRDTASISGLGRSPGGGHGNPLQYSCLGIPWTEEPGGLQSMGSQSQTQLSD